MNYEDSYYAHEDAYGDEYYSEDEVAYEEAMDDYDYDTGFYYSDYEALADMAYEDALDICDYYDISLESAFDIALEDAMSKLKRESQKADRRYDEAKSKIKSLGIKRFTDPSYTRLKYELAAAKSDRDKARQAYNNRVNAKERGKTQAYNQQLDRYKTRSAGGYIVKGGYNSNWNDIQRSVGVKNDASYGNKAARYADKHRMNSGNTRFANNAANASAVYNTEMNRALRHNAIHDDYRDDSRLRAREQSRRNLRKAVGYTENPNAAQTKVRSRVDTWGSKAKKILSTDVKDLHKQYKQRQIKRALGV